MYNTLKVLNSDVLVEQLQENQNHNNGVILINQNTNQDRGIVKVAGPKSNVAVGQHVLFDKTKARTLTINKKCVIHLEENDILAILE